VWGKDDSIMQWTYIEMGLKPSLLHIQEVGSLDIFDHRDVKEEISPALVHGHKTNVDL
jgi:hypothetical protein